MVSSSAGLAHRVSIWLLIAAIVIGLVLVVPRLAGLAGRPEYVGIAVFGGLLQAALLAGLGLLLLPRRRGRAVPVLLAVLLGATFCAGVGMQTNGAVVGLSLQPLYLAALYEEVIKLAAVAVLLIAFRPRIGGPVDGLIIGYSVGFGFAVVETALYAHGAETTEMAWGFVVARLITGVGGHAVWTGIAGAALGQLLATRGRGWRPAVAGFAAVLVLHFLWDALVLWTSFVVYLALVLVIVATGIALFTVTRRLSIASELRGASAPPARVDVPGPPLSS